MGMICYVLSVSNDLVSEINGDAELWDGIMNRAMHAHTASPFESSISHLPDHEREARRESRARATAEFTKQLRIKYPDVFAAHERATQRALHFDLSSPLCLDKAWDILEHVLTRGDSGEALFVGEPAGTNKGYGPAFLRSPSSTSAFADLLASRTAAAWLKEANLQEASKIYGIHPNDEDAANTVADVFQAYFPLLRGYVRSTAAEASGLLVWVS